MHFREDYSCSRGYELWLMEQAKARNPAIQLYALSWGVPSWIGNGSGFFTPDNWQYQTQFVRCIEARTGYKPEWLGIWNGK